MPEYELQIATRQLRRTFERAIGKSIAKILTELVANSDDSYRRLAEASQNPNIEEPAQIIIVFERAKKKFSVIDHAEGMTDEEMRERFVTYGQESVDRSKGYKTRSLFGKGLRDVLFTQRNGQVKSIKNGLFYNCRFRWKDSDGHERPVVDIKSPSRVTNELRKALSIPEIGTQVEFTLKEDVPSPQLEKLIATLSQFYLLRMINSSPHREVKLIALGRKGATEHQLNYRFPEIEVMDKFEESMQTDIDIQITIDGNIGVMTCH
jgi:Histidine kinase-, DNA gyrase B-, and HSP90-like ATPase